jgi:hypothetical protein
MESLRVGDHVPVTSIRVGKGRSHSPAGVVTALDKGGVHVKLDEGVDGLTTAYATYRECVLIEVVR